MVNQIDLCPMCQKSVNFLKLSNVLAMLSAEHIFHSLFQEHQRPLECVTVGMGIR